MASSKPISVSQNSNLFREYIGAMGNGVQFSDIPINPNVEFHFILAFAADYSIEQPYTPTDGKFNVFWDDNLTPEQVLAIKEKHPNVKVALSLGGASLGKDSTVKVAFTASSIETWVNNAVESLTKIIQEYNLDGLDVDYEHFEDKTNFGLFTECIGRLIKTLRDRRVIQFASIAPFNDDEEPNLQMYRALWDGYYESINYVNYQFYVLNAETTVDQYVEAYYEQVENFGSGRVLASFLTLDNEGEHIPATRALEACEVLRNETTLFGIFLWCADDSMANGFTYEVQSQDLLTRN